MEEIICEIFLDHVPLITKTDDKVVKSEVGINFHYMPEYRHTPDLYNRLRPDNRLFRKAATQPSRQDDNLHITTTAITERPAFSRKGETSLSGRTEPWQSRPNSRMELGQAGAGALV